MALIVTPDWWTDIWTSHPLAHQPSQISWDLGGKGISKTAAVGLSRAANNSLLSDREDENL